MTAADAAVCQCGHPHGISWTDGTRYKRCELLVCDCDGYVPADDALTKSNSHLAEEGRILASRRDDLITEGVDPAELLVPVAPAAVLDREGATEQLADLLAAHQWNKPEDYPAIWAQSAHANHTYHGACAICRGDLTAIAAVIVAAGWTKP